MSMKWEWEEPTLDQRIDVAKWVLGRPEAESYQKFGLTAYRAQQLIDDVLDCRFPDTKGTDNRCRLCGGKNHWNVEDEE